MNKIQRLLDQFSTLWGGKYLVNSKTDIEPELSKTQVCVLDSLNAQCSDDTERMKVFPIKPKDDRLLVRLWFQFVLPALPKLLSSSLGGTYAASLVRRGQVSIRSEPCIQIESPRIPSSKAQAIIRDSLNSIYKKNNHQVIPIRFLRGSVKRLNGGKEEDLDDAGESAESQRFRFNLVRPYSKPRMGASLGLICSRKVVATLGGYVLVGGEKFMLTSEHFITQSQEPANIDGDGVDLETLTSPSRYDLSWMENDLKQTKRDLDSEINVWITQLYGNQDIPVDGCDNRLILAADLRERIKDVTSLLEQVKKPSHAYAVGTVFRRSIEPRIATMATSIADIVRPDNSSLETTYHMDWSLCKLDREIAQIVENRHKYRSNEDAMADDYIEEINHITQPGDFCHETCEVASGASVYYVGQGSKHRSGVVNIPSLISRDSLETLDWGIMSADGREIPYEHVAGDSGAWVIRKNGNKLMGQIHSYSSGQVLFTPINVIFADIEKECGVDVSLPPSHPESGQVEITTPALPLCSNPRTPPIQPLKFLKPPAVISGVSQHISLPAKSSTISEPFGSPKNLVSQSENNANHNKAFFDVADISALSPPSLADSPASSVATLGSLETPPPLDLDTLSETKSEDSLAPKTFLHNRRKSITLEQSISAADVQGKAERTNLLPDFFQHTTHFLFRLTSSPRTPTWPVDRQTKLMKVRRQGTEYARTKTLRDHRISGPARSVFVHRVVV